MHDTLIEAQTLYDHLHDKDWLIIDCQYDLMDKEAGYPAYARGHIPGAIYASIHKDLSGAPAAGKGRHPVPSPEVLVRRFSKMGVSTQTRVVAYDNSAGVFAARLWWLLTYMGHSSVAVLNGGLNSWREAGFAVEQKHNPWSHSHFTANINEGALIRLDDVSSAPRLIDAREPERYSGETEPIDPVAGHIPGAKNYYWKNNLDEQGRFLSAREIKRALEPMYSGVAPEDLVFYCGSGVSACHNLMAAMYAGYPLPGLYAGSWSEWCADPTRPLAVGFE